MLRLRSPLCPRATSGAFVVWTVIQTSTALAQKPPEPPPEESTAAPVAPAAAAEAPPSDPQAAAAKPAASDTDVAAEIAALKAAIADLKQKQEEAETAALVAEEPHTATEIFKIYGFMDMGFQRYWANNQSTVSAYFNTNAATFTTGNIDLYFDFNPHPSWRALAEIRFTNAPQGNITNFGGLGGTFQRTNTEQFDPNGTALNQPMWGGYTVIERAYIQWQPHQSFQLMTGNFFTPFGIWLVDHGSPTLISIALPQFLQQKFVPLHQTGVQALGSFFLGEHELAYRAWLTNGRTEENPFDYDDNKAFGARVFLRRETGSFNFQFGASYHQGRVRDKTVEITGFSPVTFNQGSTWEYDEKIFGADVSLDIGSTRIRTEAIARRQDWRDGKTPAAGPVSPGAYRGSQWQEAAYLIVAQQLPWAGLEPYVYLEGMQQPWFLPDAVANLSGGLNVRFTASTMLKNQFTYSKFFDWKFDSHGDESLNDTSAFQSRLVMAF